ncbi:MAG: GNAT family N-acetyltransferase [Dehalococcoidia bacterium]
MAAIDDLQQLADESPRAFLSALTKALPGSEWHAGGQISWYLTGVPVAGFNGVAAIRPGDDVEAMLASVLRQFRGRKVPCLIHLRPSDPPEIATILSNWGLKAQEPAAPVLAVAPEALRAVPGPDGLAVYEVENEISLESWQQTYARSIGLSAGFRWHASVYARTGIGPGSAFRLLIAWREGRPVGTAMVFLDGPAGAIYHLATVPEARGIGVGLALASQAAALVHREGRRWALLHSSKLSAPLYGQLGFEPATTSTPYLYHPQPAKRRP